MATKPERSQYDKGFYRGLLGQGLLYGQGDEAEAYLRSKITDASYEENLAKIRKEYANYQGQYPTTAALAELGGSMAPSIALGLTGVGTAPAVANLVTKAGPLTRILRGPGGFGGKVMRTVKRGALGGSGGYIGGDIAGGGYSEAPYRSPQYEEDRKESRDMGAFIGGVATPAIEPALRSVGRWLKRKFGSGKTVDEAAGDALSGPAGGSQGARTAMDDVVNAQELDIPMVPMGANKDLEALAQTVTGKGGEPARIIQESAETITESSQLRVSSKLNEVSPYSGQTYLQTVDAIDESRKALSRPNYEKAFYEFDVKGNPVMVNGSKKPIMLSKGQDGYKEITDYLKRPAFRKGLTGAIRLAEEEGRTDEAAMLSTLLTRLSRGETPSIPLYILNEIKTGIDDVIDDTYKNMKPTVLTGTIRKAKNNFLTKLDSLFPEYGNARKIYSDKSSMIEAGENMQKKWSKLTPEGVEKFLKGLKNEADRETAKMAAVDILQKQILNPVSGKDFAQILGGNKKGGENIRRKIRMLFGNDVIKADNFEKAMMLETELYRKMNSIGKSKGQGKDGAAEYDNLTSSNPAASGILFGDEGLVRKMARLFIGSTDSDEFQDQVSLKISELLTNGSPESLATVVRLVDKASERVGKKLAQDMIQPFGIGATLANVEEAPEYLEQRYEE